MSKLLPKFFMLSTLPPLLWCSSKGRSLTLIALFVVALVMVLVNKTFLDWRLTRGSNHVFKVKYLKPLRIAIWISNRHKHLPNWYRKKEILNKIVRDQNKKHCFQRCEMKMTQDLEDVKRADAVLFFMMNVGLLNVDMPANWTKWRRRNQIWIVHAQETPPQTYDNKVPNEALNWTISYRRDSDVWLPYGRVEPIDPNPNIQQSKANSQMMMFRSNVSLSEWISGKSKLAVGVISNCNTHSKRENLIHRIKKTGKPVDIYGKCGELKTNCSFASGNCTEFWNKLAGQYKFYLAFENSFCVDYISEKFWRSLELGMVPVVYGGADYSKLAPPGSYIQVNQFNSDGSVHRLINLLKTVGKNATEYAKYFDWRKKYKLVEGNSCWDNGNAWCELCEKLRTFKNMFNSTTNGTLNVRKVKSVKTVPSLWWSCVNNNGRKGKLY